MKGISRITSYYEFITLLFYHFIINISPWALQCNNPSYAPMEYQSALSYEPNQRDFSNKQ